MRILKTAMILCLAAGQTSAQTAKSPGANEMIALPTKGKSDTLWTEEKRNAAQPRDLRLKISPGMAPGPAMPSDRPITIEAELSQQKASGNVQMRPFYWAGQLFFQAPDGSPGRCSGQFIASNIVLTAAHCVRDDKTGEWHENFEFYLQYDRDEASKAYSAQCVFTKAGWLRDPPENFKYDYALMVTDETSITGHFGWQTNWGSEYGPAVSIGYPGAIRQGEIVQYVPGDVFPSKDLPGVIGIRHGTRGFTQGASGGAWIGKFKRGENVGKSNYVISVNSFITDDNPGVMFGPYLDDEFADMVVAAKRGCR